MVNLALLELAQFVVTAILDVHEVIVSMGERTYELVELELSRQLFSTLRVLDDEDHHERDSSSASGELREPRIGNTEHHRSQRARKEPDRNKTSGRRPRADRVDPMYDTTDPSSVLALHRPFTLQWTMLDRIGTNVCRSL
jgi:hypothetical protein